MTDASITYPAAFAAGVLSFFSPCIVPLVPAYFTFISGFSLDQLTGHASTGVRSKVVLATLSFCLGFSLVFVLLGASASALGSMAMRYNAAIRVVGGLVIILLGAHLCGWLRLPFLEIDRHIQMKRRPVHFLGSFVVGMAFGAGWSPCIGPLLGSILILASSSDTVIEGTALLAIYSAGLAIPFLAISVFIHYLLQLLNRIRHVIRYVNLAAGVFLIAVGFLLVFNRFGWIWNTLSARWI